MEWLKAYAQRVLSLQRLLLLTAGLMVGFFVNTTIISMPALAVDATWEGQSLRYNNDTYLRITDETHLKNMGFGSGDFTYGVLDESTNPDQMKIIHFPAGSDISTATSAEYIVYDFKKPNSYTRKNSTTISTEAAGSHTEATTSSCGVESIGWAVCPLTTFLARGMDWAYDRLDGFLEAQPLNVTDRQSGLYLAWQIMLNIANIAFIIGFLVLIYSHLTSVGISNYGIKKMLPRLIIAALLVNFSYYICAVAIDLSNIIGHGLQDAFIQIRNTLLTVGSSSSSGSIGSWEDTATMILSGGAVLGATGVGITNIAVATGGSASSAIILLLPILLGALLTILVVLVVLAARQALIVILTIVSPLAFVCYLLPGTEKWFEKWRETFFTMLIFFPAFSAVFGGSQLAAAAIMQNATTILMIILGLAVQIAPLALAPLILKLSGGLLNRFAGVINNPNKGILDRTRNWTSEKSTELANKRSLANENLKKRNFVRRAGRNLTHRSRARKERQERLGKAADNVYNSSNLHNREALHAARTAKRAELISAREANRYAEFEQGFAPQDIGKLSRRAMRTQQSLMENAQSISHNIALEGMRKSNIQRAQNKELAESILANQEYQRLAASNTYFDENGNNLGMDAALATAVAATRSETAKSIEEAHQVLKYENLSGAQRQQLALGKSVTTASGRMLDHTNTYVLEAAIEEQFKIGTVKEVAELLAELPPEYRTSASAGLAKSGAKNNAPFLGGRLIDEVSQGKISDRSALMKYIASWIQEGKFKASDIASTDAYGIALLKEAISTHGELIDAQHRNALKSTIHTVLTDDRLSPSVADIAKTEFKNLQGML